MNLQVLDKGYVELMSHTPDGDLLVVNAARCSFDKEHKVFNEDKDTRLLNYLAREKHVLPFRHPVATLRLHMPIFVARQIAKHQVGFSSSEVSRRYITGEPEFYCPIVWREKADNVKQGSSDTVHPRNKNMKDYNQFVVKNAVHVYNSMLSDGVAPEQARMVLPQSMYTTCVMTGSLLGWHHLYRLRTEEHAQLEVQKYGRAVADIMAQVFPQSWEALCQH
jgi:thymidylate synthase (FAD)